MDDLVKVYYKGKILFAMPKKGLRMSDISIAADIIRKAKRLPPMTLKLWEGNLIQLQTKINERG